MIVVNSVNEAGQETTECEVQNGVFTTNACQNTLNDFLADVMNLDKDRAVSGNGILTQADDVIREI